MSAALKEQILAYMKSHNTMTLATASDNVPWAATVFYANHGFRLYFFSAPDSRHCQNLAVNPRVAVTIQEDYRDWRKIKGIQLEGSVRELDSLAEKARAMACYGAKYPDVIKVFTDPGSGALYQAFLKVRFYCVRAERVLYIDNEQGFGKRQELEVHEDD
ncbi:MAG TPA: pyridoxamine 5'-phosphate oxidase family protein [Candidatus Acidoferrales bacterium]|nr:pyridoxamine 5'-phosphate oxidase family protein [Candidatus Acidoferrales bacterium]